MVTSFSNSGDTKAKQNNKDVESLGDARYSIIAHGLIYNQGDETAKEIEKTGRYPDR